MCAAIENGTAAPIGTVTAANLAVALGLEQHEEVLLIDAELRKSQVHALFGLPPTPGLAELLACEETFEGVLRQGPVKQLSIMTAGHFQGNPADLFEKPDFNNFLAILKQRFRYILLDSPPILAVADGRILSCLTDGVILVARAGVTRERSIQEALVHLKHAHVLGTVLNDIAPTQFTHQYGEYMTSGYYVGAQR